MFDVLFGISDWRLILKRGSELTIIRFYVTVGAVAVCGLADALVQGGLIGAAGELPERYMQVVVAGTAASGVLVSFLRIITKAAFSQDATGLRKSAILYFMVGIALMVVCIVFYNLAHRLPLIKYYNELKAQAVIKEKQEKDPMTGAQFRSTLWKVVGHVKWFGFGIAPIYVVTLSIFPGYITKDMHSAILTRFRTEIPVTILTCLLGLTNGYFTSVLMILAPKTVQLQHATCLLGLTNGYFTSVLMILAPKTVQLQHAKTAGIMIVLFVAVGVAIGSVVAWF